MKRVLAMTVLIALPVFTESNILSAAEAAAEQTASDPFPTGNAHNALFTNEWKFFKGDDDQSRGASFDDTAWRTLDLPHDWSVEAPFDPKLASCTAFLPGGVAWYRKHFAVPADAKNKCISIRFDGVSNHSTVWCNGVQVGERPYGYSSFTCDLTPAIHFGGENVIAVRVNHAQYADSRWYAGSGIYRNVYLSVTDKLHIATYGTSVTTPKITNDSATVNVQTEVKNEGTAAIDATIATEIIDEKGESVARAEQTGSVLANGQQRFAAALNVPHPELWSPDHPRLYSACTQIRSQGKLVDETITPFGIRSFQFDSEKGFSLNGRSMKLKGVCLHHDAGALGAAVPIQVWETRLKLLQEAGCNAIRTSHNPPAPEFLDLCDRMGFLVMDEAFDEWTEGKKKWIVGHNVGQPGTDGYHSDFDKWADIDIRDMVLRDRNHPSIIMWSIGNEIDYQNDPFPPNSTVLPPVAKRLIDDVKAVDTTRPVTGACAFPATNLFKKLLDIEGYNYMEQLYPGDHAANPNRVMYGSENHHTLTAWQAVEQNDYIAGQFLWTGIDYLGEAGIWPSHGSGAGLLNLAGFPKNQYYFRKSLWADAPMVYLSTTGIFAGRGARRGTAGSNIFCFTNCDRVELFHDGKSLGSKPHAAGEVLSWPVDFTGGILKAVGTKGSATVEFELRKPGAPAKLLLKSDITELKADGRDVAQLEVDVTDNDGTLVPDAANVVTCSVEGPGRILGIENGDLRSTEDYQSLTRHAYQGRMRIYVQAAKTSGELRVSVSEPSFKPTTVSLQVRSPDRPAR